MMYQREEGLPYPQPWEFVMHSIFKNKTNLFFIDVGAHDGLTTSNSAYAEMNLGWKGICIEPHPDNYSKLIASRNCKTYNCCISEKEGELEFCCIRGHANMLSGINSSYSESHLQRIQNEIMNHGGEMTTIRIPSKTLNAIIEENNIEHVDYLSIDTEGSELNVLMGIDLHKYKVTVISVENNNYNDNVRSYLNELYDFVGKICHDEIYIRK